MKLNAKQKARIEQFFFTRKPCSLEEVAGGISGNDPLLTELPTYLDAEVLENGDFGAEFTEGVPQYFVIKFVCGTRILVDTQGASYIRYACKVVEL